MSWLLVKNFGKVKYFNISYIVMFGVPILASLYNAIDNDWLNQNLSLSFPENLKWTYGASICYAIGIAFYQFFCPKIVKRFDTEDEYVNAYQQLYERAYLDKKVDVILSNLTSNQQTTREKINALNQKRLKGSINPSEEYELDQLVHLVYSGCVQRFLVSDFDLKVKSRKWAFIISIIFYFLGTGIMIYLVYDKVLLVFQVS